MTYQELVETMQERGANLADVAIGRMMDMVEEETGVWPNWDDPAPDWVLEAAGMKVRKEV